MDLESLENALNNGDFKEQVYRSLEGIYQISKVLNELKLLENFNDHNLEIVAKIQAIKNELAGYEAKKQELEALLNTQLQSALTSEKEKLAQAGSELKNNLIAELTGAKNTLAQAGSELKNNLIAELTGAKNTLAQALKPQIQGVTKFLGIYIYGAQSLFKNESDEFRRLFEFSNIHLEANKSYITQFSMPYELTTDGIYSDTMGEMVLCLEANNKVYPIINSFYQNKTISLVNNYKIIDTYRVSCVLKTPSEEANYKMAVFARKHKELWVNVNFTPNTQGFETSFLNNANFLGLTTQSLPTDYNNDWVFHKHSKVLFYEILE
ncbi:hypothetical protein [Helicobacter pylori]|uniref:hypothetical protein n=1 Tax=Helicobacter pylori TaxID=210 RepID=UPI00041F9445|nr:hypothetical protein [Helicobacter pylori]